MFDEEMRDDGEKRERNVDEDDVVAVENGQRKLVGKATARVRKEEENRRISEVESED